MTSPEDLAKELGIEVTMLGTMLAKLADLRGPELRLREGLLDQ